MTLIAEDTEYLLQTRKLVRHIGVGDSIMVISGSSLSDNDLRQK
jgi:hypothetical protein